MTAWRNLDEIWIQSFKGIKKICWKNNGNSLKLFDGDNNFTNIDIL